MHMSGPSIRTVPIFHEETAVEVPANGALWTLALQYVAGPARIRIQVDPADDGKEQQWTCGTTDCGPGGMYTLSPTAIVPTAPIGALVAKVGGGQAECPGAPVAAGLAPQVLPASSTVYAVGRYCVINVKAGDGGPLFLTMNDDVKAFVDHRGKLKVKVAIAVG
jgi:hypothetical protein